MPQVGRPELHWPNGRGNRKRTLRTTPKGRGTRKGNINTEDRARRFFAKALRTGPCPYGKRMMLACGSRGEMNKQIPHAAEGAGFGMPILRRIGISNRNTPELKTGLSRLRSTPTCVLIATLSTTRRRVVVPSDQGESRDLHIANRPFVTRTSADPSSSHTSGLARDDTVRQGQEQQHRKHRRGT